MSKLVSSSPTGVVDATWALPTGISKPNLHVEYYVSASGDVDNAVVAMDKLKSRFGISSSVD